MCSNDLRRHVAPSRKMQRQAGRHAVRRRDLDQPRNRSVADAGAGNSPSQLRASVFCLFLFLVLETACVAASLEHSEETKQQ